MPTDTDRLLLQLDADVTRLNKQMAKAAGETTTQLKKIEHEAEGSMARLEALFGKTNVGEALQNVFKRTRLGVIEEGATKIPIFGSALEALGPAGLAAAAGVAAAGLAMEQAKAAAEYSEEIANTADKLGVTTKALQEYQFAALASGVSTEAMDEALEEGNARLGEFQSNIGSARVKKVFEALGITPEEAAKAHTIIDLLPQISAKMAGLSAAEQAAVAKRAGLEGIINVLRKGPEAIADLRSEAESSGAVLDSQLIAKGKAVAEVLKEADQIVAVNLHRAFIDLAPVIEACAKAVEGMARGLADAIELLGGISHMSRTGVMDAQSETTKALGNWGQAARFGGAKLDPKSGLMSGGGWTGAGGAVGIYNSLVGQKQREDARLKELDGIDAQDQAKTRHGTSDQLVKDKAKKGPADQTSDFDKTASDESEGARKALADAQAALTKNIEEHAADEKAAVDAETTKKLKDLAAEELKIRASKNDSHKADQLALLEQAKTDTQAAGVAKKELIDRNAAEERAKADLEYDQRQIGYTDAIMTARASMAHSAQERADLELQVFKDEQNAALEKRRQEDTAAVGDGVHGSMTPQEMQQDLSGLRGQQTVQLVEQRQQVQRQGNPLYSYANPTTSLGDDLQSIETKGLQDLNSQLTEAVMHTKTLGAAFHDVAMSIATDVVKMGIQRFVTQPIAGAIYGQQSTFGNANATGGAVEIGAMSTAAGAAATSLTGLAAAAQAAGGGGGLASGLFGSSAPQAAAAATGTSGGLMGSLIALLPHFASGTDDAPGGLSLVGEKGPELVNLPGGAGVTPNNVLSSIGKMDAGQMRPSSSSQTLNFDLRGAVMTEDLLRQANAYAEQVGRGSFAASVGVARQVVPADMNRRAGASFIR